MKMRFMKMIKKNFFFCVCCPHTKELPNLYKIVRCILTLTRSRGLNKISDLLKNAFWYIIKGTIDGRALPCCTCWNIFQGSKKCMTRKWLATHTSWNLSLITLRLRRCVKKQCAWIQVVNNLELSADYDFLCPQYSFLFLITLDARDVQQSSWKKSMGARICSWPS